jgi:two-component system cell cycle sensor histidine kinase/response regulator CckA
VSDAADSILVPAEHPPPPRTVVVVEDDEGVLRLILKQLSRESIRNIGFQEETEALRWIDENRATPLLLVLDYRLRTMDGKQFLAELSARGVPVPFLVVTGHGDERIAVELMKLGAKDYLVKDARFLDLLPAAVSRILSVLTTEGRVEELEGLLRQSQKMEAIGTLAAGVAHDFNNLLTSIIGYSELALSRLPSIDPLRKDLEEIHAAGRRAAGLTRQLLIFSRKQVVQAQTLDLGKLVLGIEKMLRRMIREDIRLVTEAGEDPAWIKADPGQIEQVLLNLVVNAKDAMPNGGILTIRTSLSELPPSIAVETPTAQRGKYVSLVVSDDGCGMDPGTMQHIFEPFFTTKALDKGTGLGLSTVYGIVKQAGGHIQVESAPHKGTTFRIWFPPNEEKELPPLAVPAATSAPGACSETILVVEDSETLLGLVRTILEGEGYQVLTAGQGEEALRIFREFQGPIRLLLSDVVMPNMNGREFVARARALQPEVKILFMSGYPEKEVGADGSLLIREPFLQKPFSPKALKEKIREILDGVAVHQAFNSSERGTAS